MGNSDDINGGLNSSVKLLDELNMLCRNIDKRLQKHSSTGFLFGQGRLLSSLAALDGVSQSTLSKSTSLSPATVTEMLDKLEAAGFVKRSKDGQDSRKLLVYITDCGRRAAKEMDASRSEAVVELFSVFSDGELSELERLLLKLNGSLNGTTAQSITERRSVISDEAVDSARMRSSGMLTGKIRNGIRLR